MKLKESIAELQEWQQENNWNKQVIGKNAKINSILKKLGIDTDDIIGYVTTGSIYLLFLLMLVFWVCIMVTEPKWLFIVLDFLCAAFIPLIKHYPQIGYFLKNKGEI